MVYSNEKKGFTFKDILVQTVIILLFVFLLVWLFPTRVSFNKLNKRVDILSSTLFGANIQTMKDAAVSYYTNERLPKAVNDVERLTLKDMLNLHLLVDFVDGNGNKCSKTDSYVEVIKLKDEYQMKINLSCTDNDAYIIVHLGCYDYCNELGVCAKEEEIVVTPNKNVTCEYEYEKVINGSWGDYGAWSNWSVSKVTEADYRQVETKNEPVLTGTRPVQTGTTVDTVAANVSSSSYCAAGFDLVNGICVAQSSNSTGLTCPNGYSLSGTNCISQVTRYADPECPSSEYSRNGFTCTKTTYGSIVKGDYIATHTGASSVPATNSSRVYETVSSDYVYKCDSSCGFRWEYTYKEYTAVRQVTTDTVEANCTVGTRSGNSCVYTDTDVVAATCPSGYNRSGNRCVPGNYAPTVSSSKSCDSDYTLSGDVCVKTVPVYQNQDVYENVTYYRYRTRTYIAGNRFTKWSKSQNDKTLFNEGYSLTGNKKCS